MSQTGGREAPLDFNIRLPERFSPLQPCSPGPSDPRATRRELLCHDSIPFIRDALSASLIGRGPEQDRPSPRSMLAWTHVADDQ